MEIPTKETSLFKSNSSAKHAQKKKLAGIVSILGNIEAHAPEMKADFLGSLKVRYPDLFIYAVEEGVIPGVHSFPTETPGCERVAVDRKSLTAGSRGLPSPRDDATWV